MPVDFDDLERRATALTEQIQKLESQLEPLRAELSQIRRRMDGAKFGRASVDQRRAAALDRDALICAEARRYAAMPYSFGWQVRLAEEFGLSTRQVRRIVKSADIKVDRYS